MQEGDVAMYRTKSDQLQLHLAQDGGYWTGPDSKKLRLQLIQGQQSQQGSQGGSSSGSSGSAAGSSSTGQMGQQPLYQQDSKIYSEISGSMTQQVNKQHQIILQDKQTGIEVNSDNNVYLGAISGQGQFLPVMLIDGTAAKNTKALKGGGSFGASADSDDPALDELNVITRLRREMDELRARVDALEGARA
jgi:hypothetical protein